MIGTVLGAILSKSDLEASGFDEESACFSTEWF